MNDTKKQQGSQNKGMDQDNKGGASQGKKGGQTDQGTELEDLSEEDADAISGDK
ncbi:MAG TPA: hypothetical protein VKC89_00595 [Patescibacteria group bacterium]|nr:hypothetical protein [Patescibacteria group bacterium]